MPSEEIVRKFLDLSCSEDFMDLYVVRSGILRAVNEAKPKLFGTLLDIGCGKMPYRELLMSAPTRISRYIGMDIENPYYRAEIDLKWDGKNIPLEHSAVDSVLCTEVLEHCPDPTALLREAHRVLRPGGVFFFTVPFVWPLHDMPMDYFRYTSVALRHLFAGAGFSSLEIKGLGGWNAALAQMIGLWVRRSPMAPDQRSQLTTQLFPFFKQLIDADQPIDPFGDNTMVPGWCGIATR